VKISSKQEKQIQNTYKKNLNYFKNYHSNIYTKLISFNDLEEFRLVFKEYKNIKIPNLEFRISSDIVYKENPEQAARISAKNALISTHWLNFNNEDKSNITNIDKVVFISSGLGFHFKYYDEYYDIKSLLIVEENLEIFILSCYVVDYERLSLNKTIQYCVNETDNILEDKILNFYSLLFFYNKSIKLVEMFVNDTTNKIVEIFVLNIDSSLYENINLSINDESIITNKNFEQEYKNITNQIFNNKSCTIKDIYTVIALIKYIECSQLDKKLIYTILNNLYYCLYYLSIIFKEYFIVLQNNTLNHIVNIQKESFFDVELYKRIVTLCTNENPNVASYFQEKYIEYLKSLNQLDKDILEYENYKLLALKGETTKQSSIQYIKHEFNNFAKSFENTLVNNLEYNIPKILTQNIMLFLNNTNRYNILDLGCGTGLVGSELELIANRLIGVDLSSKMLEIAKEKNIYSELVESDIDVFLNKQYKDSFDIITSADVFIYIGDLYNIFKSAKQILSIDGIFAFSIEHLSQNKNYKLNVSGRFSQSTNYINSLIEEFSFSILKSFETKIRKENNKEVNGYIYILKNVPSKKVLVN
jgi:predicted TPR repeat methyltransferase